MFDSGYSSPSTSYYSEEYEEDIKRQKLSNYEACPICKQNVLDPNLKIFEGPPPNALEEEAALTDDRLRLYNDGELMPDIDSLPQNKITEFEVFDREGHLCFFDSGLIENDQLIYFSGYVKPIYDEDPSGNNGVPAQELGPILQWWISGYDGGDHFLIAFLTPYAEYILMEPSEKYKEFMKSPMQKALLTKIVIEFLSNSYEPVYEELLNRIQEVTVPEGIENFDEDSLAEHAQFITDQVSEIDDDGELLSTPAMDTIINLFGVTVKKRKKSKKGAIKNLKLTEATMTPLVSKIFEEFFDNNDKYFSYTRKNGKESMSLPNSPDLKKLSSVQWEEGSNSAVVNGETISIGDFVYISSRDPSKRNRIFKIEYFFQRNFTKQVHCSEYCRGVDTILEEASSPLEFFMLGECSDWSICKIIKKVEIVIVRNSAELIDQQFKKIFFVQKRYVPAHGKFVDLPKEEINACWVCSEKLEECKRDTPYLLKGVVKYKNEEYYPGCCVLVEPFAITFDVQKNDTKIEKKIMTLTADEIVYPEIYRKAKEVSIVDESPEPFKIAYIKKISEKCIKNRKKIFLTVNKFYRPENTQIIDNTNDRFYDLQLLYWSDEEVDIEIDHVKGRCNVMYAESAPEFNSFYYNESYNYKDKSFGKAREVFLVTDLKESVVRKLRTLNPFSGCGGLAEGLTQSGVADIGWGIDIDEPTANAFKMNFPAAKVFNMDCNLLLKDLLSGEFKDDYPKKGEVEMLIGGPPCQGFSTMNRFTSQQYSQFKNSLIVTYLSYCDYYRPKYFVLENVKNFICFKKSVLLKHVLGCLVAMGYQCTFGVLQGGNYGLPQTRRRLFIMAAAPGNPLPKFPNPTHAFYRQLCGYEVEIVGKPFVPDFSTDGYHTAPFRMITIRDALHDLPSLGKSLALKATSYQKFIKSPNVSITEHICKEVSPLNEARIKHIPAEKDCDWRDLPNISVRLRDGTYTNVLKYTHHDRKNGKSKCGLLRGVCACATGKSCDSSFRQNNTLIPWCLSHTANRNNNWSGLYGRLDWDGCFSTTITNPEPSCKQGRVLHPQEDRIVSVRECARSQGLPDYFKFSGTIMEKYRQVGNAVPPPMSRALGFEIKKCIERM